MSLRDLATNALQCLKNTPGLLERPIAFVCHSLGGLLLKEMLRVASKDLSGQTIDSSLLNNVAQVTFISTPHNGSQVAGLWNAVGFVTRASRITGFLQEKNEYVKTLNQWYRNFCSDKDKKGDRIDHLVLFEDKKTSPPGDGFLANYFSARVVDEDGADPVLAHVELRRIPEADHYDICKPKNDSSEVFQSVAGLLSNLVPDGDGRRRRSSQNTRPAPGSKEEEKQRFWPEWGLFRGPVYASIVLVLIGGLGAVGWRFATGTSDASISRKSEPDEKNITKAPPPPHLEIESKPNDEVIYARARIPNETDTIQLADIAKRFPELAREVQARKGEIDEKKRRREQEETTAAAVEIETTTDRPRLTEIAARWPSLKPNVNARLAAQQAEADDMEQKRKAAADAQGKKQRADEDADAKAELERMTRAAQDGLRRAGCFSGQSTGTWGSLTRKAAEDFNRHAPTKISAAAPTPEAETILAAVKTRVCPLVCVTPKVAKDGACFLVNCSAGTVWGAGGSCEPAYVARVGMHHTLAGAELLFADLQQSYADLLGDKQPDYKTAGGNQWVSVRVGPAATKEAMRELCAKLKTAGLADKCIVAPM